MGGRLFLEYFDGAKDTRVLIALGTPYSGSVNALEFLANGFRKGWGPFTVDLSDTLRSFTSVHQLLPSYRCIDGNGQRLRIPDVDWSVTAVDGADRVSQIWTAGAYQASVLWANIVSRVALNHLQTDARFP